MQVPYDIWKMIVSYLPVGQVKGLYTVDRMLFDIAMDLRYQEARIWTGTRKARVRVKDLRVFRYPHLSYRPKTLHIDLGSIAESLLEENETEEVDYKPLGQMIPSIVDFVTGRKPEQPDLAVSEIVAVGLDALPRLTSVTKVYVVHGHKGAYRDDPLVAQLLKDVWRIFGDRLRFLQVRVVFDNLELIFPTSLRLPCLEALTVNSWGFSSFTARACQFIVPAMIQSHSSTLCDVSFTTNNAAVDPQLIFQSLLHLPHLQAIHLSFPFSRYLPRPFPAYDVLYSCRRQLKSLSLDFEHFHEPGAVQNPSSIFSEKWCSIDLPRLRELRINPPYGALEQELVDFIQRFAPTLVSLWIKPNIFLRYDGVKRLCSKAHDFLYLQDLSISVTWFCPDILALLARTLPRLQTLKLSYYDISHTTDRGDRDVRRLPHLFARAMELHTHMFREWQLVSLDYENHSGSYSRSHHFEKTLANHLLNVEWFCGVDRSTYLNRTQELPPPQTLLQYAFMTIQSTTSRR